MNDAKPGARITAFYGFKGGAGRSFLLATCAVALAALGRRVLVFDWDLEAPGVGDLFDSAGNDLWVEWRRRKGIVELLQDPQFPPRTRLTDDNRQSLKERLREELLRYEVSIVSGRESAGRLSLIGPGQYLSGAHYFGKFLESDWTWYFENRGTDFFDLLREVLIDSEDVPFDEILIDARTGYSVFSVAAIRSLADCVCVVGTFSMQSINGVARVWPLLEVEDRPLRRCHILSRSPRNLPHRLQADIEGKLKLLEEYNCRPLYQLPVISNLHGGDGHLWSRDELLKGTAPAETNQAAGGNPSSEVRSRDEEALADYLKTLEAILKDVFPGLDVPEPAGLKKLANDWWREFANTQKVISPEWGENLSWQQQNDEIEEDLQNLKAWLTADPSRVQRDARSGAVEAAPATAEGWPRNPEKQRQRPLAARAMMAVRVNEALARIERPAHVPEEKWRERREQLRLDYGADVSPIAAEERVDDAVPESPRERPLQALKKARSLVWLGVEPTRDWYEQKHLLWLAEIGQACAAESRRVSLYRDADADRDDTLDGLQAYADVLEDARLLRKDPYPLEEATLVRAVSAAIDQLLRALSSEGRAPRPVTERLRAHERLLWCLREAHERAPLETRTRSVLRVLDRAFTAGGHFDELGEKLAYWSEQVVKLRLRLSLPDSAERAAASLEICRLADDYASGTAAIRRPDETVARLIDEVSGIGERLGWLCYEVDGNDSAVRCLLSAVRIQSEISAVEGLDLCLERLGTPHALRATKEIAERFLQSAAGDSKEPREQDTSASLAAFIREWREFGLGYQTESDGKTQYSTYTACLRGLDEWLSKAHGKPGALLARERELVRPFYIGYELELGRDVNQERVDRPKPNRYISLQRARFLIANARIPEALDEIALELASEPRPPLVPGDSDAFRSSAMLVLRALGEVLRSDGEAPDLRKVYANAERGMAVVNAAIALRAFPFDNDLEERLRRGLRTTPRDRTPRSADTVPSYRKLGLSTGTEWPARSRADLAATLVEYAELCIRCRKTAMARNAVNDALSLLELTESLTVPAAGFTAPLSTRMALPAALALAMRSKLSGETAALKTALKWAEWDCADERHGGGRRIYYDRVLRWCSVGTAMRKPVEAWLSRPAPSATV